MQKILALVLVFALLFSFGCSAKNLQLVQQLAQQQKVPGLGGESGSTVATKAAGETGAEKSAASAAETPKEKSFADLVKSRSMDYVEAFDVVVKASGKELNGSGEAGASGKSFKNYLEIKSDAGTGINASYILPNGKKYLCEGTKEAVVVCQKVGKLSSDPFDDPIMDHPEEWGATGTGTKTLLNEEAFCFQLKPTAAAKLPVVKKYSSIDLCLTKDGISLDSTLKFADGRSVGIVAKSLKRKPATDEFALPEGAQVVEDSEVAPATTAPAPSSTPAPADTNTAAPSQTQQPAKPVVTPSAATSASALNAKLGDPCNPKEDWAKLQCSGNDMINCDPTKKVWVVMKNCKQGCVTVRRGATVAGTGTVLGICKENMKSTDELVS